MSDNRLVDTIRRQYEELLTDARQLERDLRIAEAKNKGSLANNLCPDHRDKQQGKPCLACEIERLSTQSAAQPSAEYKVTIGLYRDRMTPTFQCLILEGADLQIGGGSASGTWDLVRKFKCSFTDADLKMAAAEIVEKP